MCILPVRCRKLDFFRIYLDMISKKFLVDFIQHMHDFNTPRPTVRLFPAKRALHLILSLALATLSTALTSVTLFIIQHFWGEVDYNVDVCRAITKWAHIKTLMNMWKLFNWKIFVIQFVAWLSEVDPVDIFLTAASDFMILYYIQYNVYNTITDYLNVCNFLLDNW